MKLHLAILFLFIGVLSFSQQNISPAENLTIEEQFDEIYKKSSKYEDYKVIKIYKFNKLKKNILDSLKVQKSSLINKKNTISTNKKQIVTLQEKQISLKNQLNTALESKSKRFFLAMPVSKSLFSILIAITYAILIALVVFFAFKFKKNSTNTKNAISNLKHLEEEFEQHKKSSLKRYQEINRKLQDELNKQWKKDNKA